MLAPFVVKIKQNYEKNFKTKLFILHYNSHVLTVTISEDATGKLRYRNTERRKI